jgi:hypothetical protein
METDVISNTPSLSTNINSSEENNTLKYIIIFLILALLGYNIFLYIGNASNIIGYVVERILNVIKPILAYFGYNISETVKKTIDLTATGSKEVIDVASGTLTGGINVLQSGLSKPINRKNNDINPSFNKGNQMQGQPMPDDAGSSTQASKGTRKAGFCYIGEDRGFRSCISVGEGDSCMSGDIFPSRDLCINPNLRSG